MIFKGENTLEIVSPNTTKETIIFAIFLLLLVIIYIVLCMMMDRRKKEKVQMNILDKKGRAGSEDASHEAEEMFDN